MKYRKRMTKRASKKAFRKGSGVHKRNLRAAPMRGGIRL